MLYRIYQDLLLNQIIHLVLPIVKSRFLYLRRIIKKKKNSKPRYRSGEPRPIESGRRKY
jgi:hypothetical protein